MDALIPRRTITTVTAAVLALPFVAGLATLTLAPLRVEQRAPHTVAVVLAWVGRTFGSQWATLAAADAAANVLVFVPVGILAYLMIPRRAWIAALMAGPAIATTIELLQALYLPQRVPSLLDVAWASIGSAVGVGIAALCTMIVARPRRDQRA